MIQFITLLDFQILIITRSSYLFSKSKRARFSRADSQHAPNEVHASPAELGVKSIPGDVDGLAATVAGEVGIVGAALDTITISCEMNE